MHRSQVLHRPDPLKLWAMLDEAALRRPVGGTATMCAQLEFLTRVTELPNVTVRVLPFSAGGHAAAGGPISILRLPAVNLPDVVYLEHLTSACYPDTPADIFYYNNLMNNLAVRGEPATSTPQILHRIINET